MTARPILVFLLAPAAVGCGEPTSNNGNDETVVIINNGPPNNAATNNGVQNNGAPNNGDDPRCADMSAGIEASSGLQCPPADCPTIPCACADGSVIHTAVCANEICQGLPACESACGEVLECGLGANNGANNGGTTENNGFENNIGGPDDDAVQGDPCTCDDVSDPDMDRHSKCYGTEDGCDGAFGDPFVCIYNQRSNTGVCRVECSEDDYLQTGPCPAGSVCERFPSLIHDDLNPSYFYACS